MFDKSAETIFLISFLNRTVFFCFFLAIRMEHHIFNVRSGSRIYYWESFKASALINICERALICIFDCYGNKELQFRLIVSLLSRTNSSLVHVDLKINTSVYLRVETTFHLHECV